MKIINLLVLSVVFVAISCTREKTDYEAEINTRISENNAEKEVFSILNGEHKISVVATNGVLYKGFNYFRVKIFNVKTNENIFPSEISFTPIYSDNGSKMICPHSKILKYNSADQAFDAYSIFYDENEEATHWDILFEYKIGNQIFTAKKEIIVEKQTNKNLNMTSFVGDNGEKYLIALISPFKPKVGENELVAGIFKQNIDTWESVNHYILKLDPRMPEPSMGNHSSPNNKDLTQQADGFYHGVVNYTMTGNWTLNFILEDENNKIIRGNAVSKEHTPGVDGKKSELFIDILF